MGWAVVFGGRRIWKESAMRRFGAWLKWLEAGGVLFFFIKGLVWLTVLFVAAAEVSAALSSAAVAAVEGV